MLTPRQRLAHKLRDGAYRARLAGNYAVTISVSEVEHWLTSMVCHYCGDPLLGIYALDHKQPLAKGGSHTLDNICLACVRCNELKHTETEVDFLEYIRATTGL